MSKIYDLFKEDPIGTPIWVENVDGSLLTLPDSMYREEHSRSVSPRQCEGLTFSDYRPETFDACKPLGPFVTSNSTACPSFRDLYPSP